MQGNYGLAIDNLISARLITADGKAITVSATENVDLWWGMRKESEVKLDYANTDGSQQFEEPAIPSVSCQASKSKPTLRSMKASLKTQNPNRQLSHRNPGQHWQQLLAFTPDKIEAVTEAINALDFKAGMSIHYIFGCFPPDFNVSPLPVHPLCPPHTQSQNH